MTDYHAQYIEYRTCAEARISALEEIIAHNSAVYLRLADERDQMVNIVRAAIAYVTYERGTDKGFATRWNALKDAVSARTLNDESAPGVFPFKATVQYDRHTETWTGWMGGQ